MNFGHIFGFHGRKQIVSPEMWEAYQRKMEEKSRTPQPPAIQNLLKKAYRLKERLDSNPDLTRLALAKELGIDPSYMTSILNLIRSAPKIQAYIMAMFPTNNRSPISDRQWMRLARIRDHALQLREFQNLLTACKRNSTTSHDIESRAVQTPDLACV